MVRRILKVALGSFVLLVAAFLFAAFGGVNIPAVNDVKFLSIDVVTEKSQLKGHSERLPVLRVNFSSKTDLESWAATPYSIGTYFSLCTGTDFDLQKKMLAGIAVYDTHGYVVGARKVLTSKADDHQAQEIPYQTYMHPEMASFHDPNWPDEWKDYDLIRNPADVCFYVWGVGGYLTRFISNTVVIPKHSIADAIRRAGWK